MGRSKRWLETCALGSVAAAGCYLRWKTLYDRPLWLDEREQLTHLKLSMHELLVNYLPGIPGGLPGDYLLTWPLAQFSVNKWILAMPHIAMLLFGYFFLFRICQREFQSGAGRLMAVALFSFNVNLIFHALELRPYASLPTLALLFYWVAGDWLSASEPWPAWKKACWMGLIWLLLVFHVYGTLIVTCVLAYILLTMDREWPARLRLVRQIAPFTLGGIFAAVPIMWYFLKDTYGKPYGVDVHEFSGQGFISLMKFVLANLGNLGLAKSWLAILALVGIGLVAPVPGLHKRWVFLGLLIALPIGLIYLQDVRYQYWFVQRQFVWVMPFYALLAGLSIDAIVLRLTNIRS